MKVKHIAWDNSRIAQVAARRYNNALYCHQKETKTKCGSKVIVGNISNDAATCPACLEAVADVEADREKTLTSMGKFYAHCGYDFAALPHDMYLQIYPYYDLAVKALQG